MTAAVRPQRRDSAGPLKYDVDFDARLGASVSGSYDVDEPPTTVRVNDQPIASAFGAAIQPQIADLIDVAVAVYTADRLCRRGTHALTWARTMRVRIPVRVPALWMQHTPALVDLLQFLTGDKWHPEFVRRDTEPRASEAQGGLFPEPATQPSIAMLFSGGLDSYAGLAKALLADSRTGVISVSVLTNNRIGVYQRACLAALDARFGGRIRPVAVRIVVERQGQRGFDGEERSQRTRGFLFQAIGAATAFAGSVTTLHVPENGIGAINLPYSPSQFGTQAGRAANPQTVARMSAFVSGIVGQPFSVQLPYLLDTKSELLNALTRAGLEPGVRDTVSCDRFGFRIAGCDHCGTCTSCLLRRQSLYCAGQSKWDVSSRYKDDLFARRKKKIGLQWFRLHAMDDQVARLEASLQGRDPRRALVQAFPSLHEQFVLLEQAGRPNAAFRVIEMYQRYCNEWRAFAEHRRSRDQ